MEVTPKTLADVKGGTLISYEDRVQVTLAFNIVFLVMNVACSVFICGMHCGLMNNVCVDTASGDRPGC